MHPRPWPAALAAAWLLAAAPFLAAQPTYKLDVKPNLKPEAKLLLDGVRLTRSAVTDDPGFRLQYHVRQDGKTVATLDARADQAVEVPRKEPGTYTVVLELFYPAYKGGTEQKGEYRAISNVVGYRVEAGAKPGEPGAVMPVETPALRVRCGKGQGKDQSDAVSRGYGYKLLRGTPFDGWPATAAATYCWQDAQEVRFEVQVPDGVGGTLRLRLLDGDGQKRREKVSVGGKALGDFDGFAGAGKTVEAAVAAAEVKGGKIEVVVQNLNPAGTAVISMVEFVAAR
jgi:hypothetical protein